MDKRSSESGECFVREETQSEEQSSKDVKEKSEISKPNQSKDDEFLKTSDSPADTDQLSGTVILPEEVQVSDQDNIVRENFFSISMESTESLGEDHSINKPVTITTESTLQNSTGPGVLHSSPYKPHTETKVEPPVILNSSEVALDRNSNIQSPKASCSWMEKTPEKVLKRGPDFPVPPKKSDKRREFKFDIVRFKMSKRKLLQKHALPPTPDNSDDEMRVPAEGAGALVSPKPFIEITYPQDLPTEHVFPNISEKIRDLHSKVASLKSDTNADSSEGKRNTGCSEEINKISDKCKRHLDTDEKNESERSKAIKSATIPSSPTKFVNVMESGSSSTVSCQKAVHDLNTPITLKRKRANSFETPLSGTSSRTTRRHQRSLSAPEGESPKYEFEGTKKAKLCDHSPEEGSNISRKFPLPQKDLISLQYIQRKKISLPCISLPCTPIRSSTEKSSVLCRKDVEESKASSPESLSAHFGTSQPKRMLSTTFPPPTPNRTSSVNSPTQKTILEASEAQADQKQSESSVYHTKVSFEKETADGELVVGEGSSQNDRADNERSVSTSQCHRTGDVPSVTEKKAETKVTRET